MKVRLSVGVLLVASPLLVQGAFESASVPVRRTPVSFAAGHAQQASASSPADHGALLETYCLGCHTEQQKARGLVPIALDNLNLSNIGANAREWESVVRKMRAGMMPPANM